MRLPSKAFNVCTLQPLFVEDAIDIFSLFGLSLAATVYVDWWYHFTSGCFLSTFRNIKAHFPWMMRVKVLQRIGTYLRPYSQTGYRLYLCRTAPRLELRILGNQITGFHHLTWCPTHEGMEGDARADRLACILSIRAPDKPSDNPLYTAHHLRTPKKVAEAV